MLLRLSEFRRNKNRDCGARDKKGVRLHYLAVLLTASFAYYVLDREIMWRLGSCYTTGMKERVFKSIDTDMVLYFEW